MKGNLLATILLANGLMAHAQAPQLLNYQGIARNSSGTPIAGAPIGLQIIIHDGSASGTSVYTETQTPTTNAFGLYSVAIGNGNPSAFGAINWGSGSKFMEVGIDPAGGSSYTPAGTSQLLSVPYSIYSNSTGAINGNFNYVPRFNSGSTLGNSRLIDDDSTVTLDTSGVAHMSKFLVKGAGRYIGAMTPFFQAGIVAMGAEAGPDVSGVYGAGGWKGVFGYNPGIASGYAAIGVHGRLGTGSSYTAGYGVLAEAAGTATGGGVINYGIYASATGAPTNWAGYFSGNVNITGSIAKASGTFKIDHPLDPENKYLYHSFVESPDMMNIYNGNVATDANGNATVTLPDYFDALNKDFRYQLTTIGQPAQVYISKEISDNQFEIKSDKPNVKVSWMVTGVRHDKYADAHRVTPEVEKEAQNKGLYLHAAEWGQPESKSIDFVNGPKTSGDNTVAKKATSGK